MTTYAEDGKRPAIVSVVACRKKWSELTPTKGEPLKRWCSECDQLVVRVLDMNGLKVAVAAGRCVFAEFDAVYAFGGSLDVGPALADALNWNDDDGTKSEVPP